MPADTNPHPGNDYYVDTLNGSIQRGYMAAQFRFVGHPIAGPFNWAQAVKVANASNLNKDVIKPAKDTAKAVTGGIVDVGDFFHRLTEPQTWTRVGEVIFGGILVYAGVRALSHGSAVTGSGARSSATRPVKKVARKTARVVVPEARLASRVAAKKVAPKTTARVARHRENVAKYGAKKPYSPPVKRPPTMRESHIYYHRAPKPTKAKP